MAPSGATADATGVHRGAGRGAGHTGNPAIFPYFKPQTPFQTLFLNPRHTQTLSQAEGSLVPLATI